MIDPPVRYYVDPDEGVWRAEDFVDPEGEAEVYDAITVVDRLIGMVYFGPGTVELEWQSMKGKLYCPQCDNKEAGKHSRIDCPVLNAELWLDRQTRNCQS